MGCDIHLFVERRVDNEWTLWGRVEGRTNIAQDGKVAYVGALARTRNYDLFAVLAGVRGDGPDPRGLPPALSLGGTLIVESYDSDGHSHSWLPLRDACVIFGQEYIPNMAAERLTEQYPGQVMRKVADVLFGVDIDEEKEFDLYRVVFFFDN